MRRPILVAVLVVAATSAAFPTATLAAPPPGWGWVTARKPTTPSYTPAAKDRGNSSGGTNTVTRITTGYYHVSIPGISNGDGGDVQVSALGSTLHRCVVQDWSLNGPDVGIDVICSSLNGATSADSAFAVAYMEYGNVSGQIAYAFANNPTTTDYTVNAGYEWPSNIHIHRSAAGTYDVTVPTFDESHVNVQVTGYANASCGVTGVNASASDTVVHVYCQGGDRYFDIFLAVNVGLTGVVRPKAAYLYANPTQSTAATRAPVAFRYSSTGGAPTVTRNGVGNYTVTLAGMPKGGVANVTSDQASNRYCWLRSIRGSGSPQKIGVNCVNLSGNAADSTFDLSYTK